MKNLVYILLIYSLSGCGIKNIDKPPPPWWENFSGNGASEKEIRKALLECGSNLPGESREIPGNIPDNEFNETVLIKKCMQASGFRLKQSPDVYCHPNRKDPKTGEPYPACSPDAIVPTRSIETRLNSPYCKLYPNSSFCK